MPLYLALNLFHSQCLGSFDIVLEGKKKEVWVWTEKLEYMVYWFIYVFGGYQNQGNNLGQQQEPTFIMVVDFLNSQLKYMMNGMSWTI